MKAENIIKIDKEYIRNEFEKLQDIICTTLESTDGEEAFREDIWKREEGGGGTSRVLENGSVFEKAGVNTSTVWGKLTERMARQMNVDTADFFATGISLVIHPRSPMVPTVHMNLRYFEMENGSSWFGGGTDLTPYYLVDDDIRHFHSALKHVCDTYDSSYYPRFKKWCDEYFFIKHRNEARGVGGIFFDYLKGSNESLFSFVKDVGNSFLPSYIPLVERRQNEPYNDEQRQWQLIRRGRYVEFNLVYDRGTLFGLETKGRIESILMSLPPFVSWKYDYRPAAGSREEKLLEVLQKPREWVE